MKVLAINPHKCSGCRLCELACSLKNTGEFNPARARIQVIGYDDPFCLSMTCLQCEQPYCMEACPTRGITKDPSTGVVSVSKEKCVGCKLCTLACPFGNIFFSSDDRVAVKCQLCDGQPECALFCPTGALEFREAEVATMAKKTTLSERLKAAYEGIG